MAVIRYLVDDVKIALTFYTQNLGFEEVERWEPAFATVVRGDLTLWLSGPQSSAARPMPDRRHPQPGGWNRLVIVVDDLIEISTRLREEGVPFRNEIVSGPGGVQILLEDPSGNPVELFQPA